MNDTFFCTGNGEPIVLLHGSMGAKEQWLKLARELSSNFRVIGIDLLGYGQCPWPDNLDTYCLADESRYISRILKSLISPEAPYHLVGHSYGGAVALHHCMHNKEQVRSLSLFEPMSYHLLGPEHPVMLESKLMVNEIIADIESGGHIRAAGKFIDLWRGTGTFSRLGSKEQQQLGHGVKKMVYDFRAAANEPFSPHDLSDLNTKCCLMLGKDSPAYSLSIGRVVAQSLSESEVHWVEGGHFAPFTHAHSVQPIITEFLKKQLQVMGTPVMPG